MSRITTTSIQNQFGVFLQKRQLFTTGFEQCVRSSDGFSHFYGQRGTLLKLDLF